MTRTLLPLLFLLACTGAPEVTPDPSTETPAPAAAAQEAAHGDHHATDGSAVPDLPAIPAGSRVFFVSPEDGATVSSPVKVVMGIEGMTVKPAKEVEAGTGHHHILVDTEGVPQSQVVPKDAQHIHFGDGSTETELELTPGEHTLMLQFADGIHRSYGPTMSATIKVTVQ